MVNLEIDFKIGQDDAEILLTKVLASEGIPALKGEFLKSVYDPVSGYYLLDVRGRLVWSCDVETPKTVVDLYNAFVTATIMTDASTKDLRILPDGSQASFTVDVCSPGGRLISSRVEIL